jgi:hypothetical protein
MVRREVAFTFGEDFPDISKFDLYSRFTNVFVRSAGRKDNALIHPPAVYPD